MIDSFGTEAQRQKWNPKMAALDVFSSYCLTEPNAGSDAASLQTRAVKDGDNYILNGSKCFISGGGVSDMYIVMARTGGPGAKGVSTFLVEKGSKGLSFGANEKKMGWNCSPTATVNFDDCVVPAENLLGGVEGQGFKFAMKGLDGGRINISALSLGGAQTALNRAIEYTSQRKQFGKPLNENQWVQFSIADMTMKLTASRLMVHRAAEMVDAKHPQASMHAAMAKKFATETCSDIADLSLQLHGGYGYLQDFPLEKIVRDLRVHQILEGTNQIMQQITFKNITNPRQ
jgi:alkylation response protein AidB-like acyl-CoA dehydrogenase